MSKKSTRLGLIEPEYLDHVKIPDYWDELVERIEKVLIEGGTEAGVFEPGDIKFSVQDKDHGRWLKLDGRELGQGEIEALLKLPATSALPFMELMGTGAASKYGVAAAGKVKLKDARRTMPMCAGPKGDGDNTFTERPINSRGGEEFIKLTASQSGVRGHTHVITDPEHTHVITDPEHSHGATQPSHNHGHNSYNAAPAENHYGYFNGGPFVGITADIAAQPSITVAKAKTGVTVNKAKTGITVNEKAGEGAAEAHPNMPPFNVLGFAFIRV